MWLSYPPNLNPEHEPECAHRSFIAQAGGWGGGGERREREREVTERQLVMSPHTLFEQWGGGRISELLRTRVKMRTQVA